MVLQECFPLGDLCCHFDIPTLFMEPVSKPASWFPWLLIDFAHHFVSQLVFCPIIFQDLAKTKQRPTQIPLTLHYHVSKQNIRFPTNRQVFRHRVTVIATNLLSVWTLKPFFEFQHHFREFSHQGGAKTSLCICMQVFLHDFLSNRESKTNVNTPGWWKQQNSSPEWATLPWLQPCELLQFHHCWLALSWWGLIPCCH